MNILISVFVLCCVSIINAEVVNQKRFTQNFFGPVYKQNEVQDKFVIETKFPTTNNPGSMGHTKRDISNQLPSRALEGEVVKDIKVVKKSTYKTSDNLDQKKEKRAFNQQFNGPIMNQQNIENYQKQDFLGPITSQLNIDNSGNDPMPPHVSHGEDYYQYRSLRSTDNKLDKRAFNQQFNGPIMNQQNIENYQKQDFYGPIATQLNIDNSNSAVQSQPVRGPVGGPVGGPARPRPHGGNRFRGGDRPNRYY